MLGQCREEQSNQNRYVYDRHREGQQGLELTVQPLMHLSMVECQPFSGHIFKQLYELPQMLQVTDSHATTKVTPTP